MTTEVIYVSNYNSCFNYYDFCYNFLLIFMIPIFIKK